jgi:hypothetical protein
MSKKPPHKIVNKAVKSRLKKSHHVWACVGMCGCVWACVCVFGRVGVCGSVLVCKGVLGHALACVGMPKA